MIGTKLAHYEITSHLGSGGMGDVYQATDTKLGRSVAIKFLPEAFSHDTERVARFQREARVLASLNHSNIAAIHGVEEIESRHFLVMELVAGETLADRIKRGPILIEEALPIAKQIAEALEEAHEKGVIHRDLKPANIKLTPDGKVKVLDFGLAKAYEREQANPSLSNSPTISMAATNAGVILGTAAYMAPEQAKGKAADAQSDIWAFGVVLYETLTGKSAFGSETIVETLGGVTKVDPDWNALPETTPPHIRSLLRRCLQKDRRRRLRAIADARLEIEEPLSDRATVDLAVAPQRRGRERLLWAVASVLAVAASIYTTGHLGRTSTVDPEIRLDIATPATSNDPLSPTISPDGRTLVFVASPQGKVQLWIRPLDAGLSRPLPGTDRAFYPFWSPDSQSIGFFAEGKLKRIAVGGGPAQTLADAPNAGGTWGPDGTILFGGDDGLYRLSVDSGVVGDPVRVTQIQTGQLAHRFPQFLPDGRHFLFSGRSANASNPDGTFVGSLDGSPPKRLLSSPGAALYVSPGFLLFRRERTLFAQRFDLTGMVLTGDAFPAAYETVVGSTGGTGLSGAPEISTSSGGTIAYRTGQANNSRLSWLDRSGRQISVIGDRDDPVTGSFTPELSPDGRYVAVRRLVGGNNDIWVIETERGIATRLTRDAAPDQEPLWSPDGSRIVFGSLRNGKRDLYGAPSRGTGAEELLLDTPLGKFATDWSSDGRFILYHQRDANTGNDIWALPLSGDKKPMSIAARNFDERDGQFSKDVRWIAYESNESGRLEIVVQPFPNATAKWQVSIGGGSQPRWRADGKELFYIAPDGTLMAVPISASSERTVLEPGRPTPLFRTPLTQDERPGYDITPDGQRFVMSTPVEEAASHVVVLLNWHPERGN